MLRRHVLSFEQLHGGRCEDVRRFCNFIIRDQSLSGGIGTPEKTSQAQPHDFMHTPPATLPGPDQSPPDSRPTPRTPTRKDQSSNFAQYVEQVQNQITQRKALELA